MHPVTKFFIESTPVFNGKDYLPPMKMLRSACYMSWFASAVVFAGCGNDSGGPIGDESAACAVAASFTSIYTNRLSTTSCARGGCHATSSSAGGLDFEQAQVDLHSDLVEQASRGRPAENLVAPGQSAQSYFLAKLTDGSVPGGIMPPGGSLDQCEIDAITAWIDAGALND